MGFFKDFKEDLSQAVNELLPDEVLEDGPVVNTLEEDVKEDANQSVTEEAQEDGIENDLVDENEDEEMLNALLEEESDEADELLRKEEEGEVEATEAENNLTNEDVTAQEETKPELTQPDTSRPVDFDESEVTIISKSTVISGNMNTNGSLEVMGSISGDVNCQGKLSIIGSVTGNCTAKEVYVGAKRLVGSIICTNSVKIGLGTVILGDITATEGHIAGAVKGDIDINGPIVIDSSAIIKGNIKAQSIQINNGAVIEGFCSLSYASIDIENIFE
ncbi:MAG: polymer-forming cytoskeletal protein [Anaerocolumna sp.]